MSAIASFGFYDFPPIQQAWDGFWQILRPQLEEQGFTDLPTELNRKDPLNQQWRQPELIISQSCGYDLMLSFSNQVQLVGSFSYSAPDCEGFNHCSYIVVHKDSPAKELADLRDLPAVVNSQQSNSGMNVFRSMIAPLTKHSTFFAGTKLTGSHEASLKKVAQREAEVTCVDCISFAFLQKHLPEVTDELRILKKSKAFASPPLITAKTRSQDEVEKIQKALKNTFEDSRIEEIKPQLMLKDFVVTEPIHYQLVIEMEAQAGQYGYGHMDLR